MEKPRTEKRAPTLAPKTTGNLDFMDDSDDEEETMQVDKPKSSVASELENCLDCRDVAADPLEFGEIIGRVSSVYLKLLSRRSLLIIF